MSDHYDAAAVAFILVSQERIWRLWDCCSPCNICGQFYFPVTSAFASVVPVLGSPSPVAQLEVQSSSQAVGGSRGILAHVMILR